MALTEPDVLSAAGLDLGGAIAGRRAILRGLALLPAFELLSGCGHPDATPSSEFLGGTKFLSAHEYDVVAALSDTIIPQTDTPGALAAEVPKFIQQLLSSWASAETRGRWRSALKSIDDRLSRSGDFTRLSPNRRAEVLGALDAEVYADQTHALIVYRDIKKTIGDSFYASEVGATRDLQYVSVPGAWRPNVPTSEIVRTWAT